MAIFIGAAMAAPDTREMVRRAISPDSEESAIAIKYLRKLGQQGLNALTREYSSEIQDYRDSGSKSDLWRRISIAVDETAMQKDAFASNLFWHVNLENALAESKASGKPVISLRLLGRLNEEYSCANSRFFRSVLYSNEEISAYLRNNYVLHWESVRPAPRITIDFGDGRKLIRTITGNSIHYILDQNGKIIDALPGLYSPKVFYDYLVRINGADRTDPRFRKLYWSAQRASLLAELDSGLYSGGGGSDELRSFGISSGDTNENSDVEDGQPPTALEAAPRAVTKALVEMPMVRAISSDVESLRATPDRESWRNLAEIFGKAAIDTGSRNFIRLKMNRSSKVPDPAFSRLISKLEESISIDTVQNEYFFHLRMYDWLENDPESELSRFNQRVYEELFLTPESDKWLGLYSSEVYSAIESNGVID